LVTQPSSLKCDFLVSNFDFNGSTFTAYITAVIRATATAKNLHTLAAHANVTAAAAPLLHETPFGHAWWGCTS
jgi:hypothetical protein